MRVAAVILLIVVLIAAGYAAFAYRPAIDPTTPPDPTQFDRALVARGAKLAAIGNCHVCHTARNGRSFAGGRAMNTPFGTLYSTNITPDAGTGIGGWSEQAFQRSMREGVDREGRHLYPAFPYDHFTLLMDEDIRALYAFCMTREAVSAPPFNNTLRFPFNLRPLIAGWKLLYFRTGRFEPDARRDTEWNHGAYLAEGLGHCGACHTPRNVLGAEKKRHALSGGEVEGWYAYAIDASSPSPTAWETQSLADFLRHGWHPRHGISRGPMAPVTTNLAAADDNDLRAIARYIVSGMQPRRASRHTPETSRPDPNGQIVYQSACASCHDGSRPLPFGGIRLDLSTAVHGPNPRNLIQVSLYGLPAAEGRANPIMPGFEGAMSDAQLAALLRYLRAQFSDQPEWTDIDDEIAAVRNSRKFEAIAWH
jgi:mono/diheme cytochrome c family protein